MNNQQQSQQPKQQPKFKIEDEVIIMSQVSQYYGKKGIVKDVHHVGENNNYNIYVDGVHVGCFLESTLQPANIIVKPVTNHKLEPGQNVKIAEKYPYKNLGGKYGVITEKTSFEGKTIAYYVYFKDWHDGLSRDKSYWLIAEEYLIPVDIDVVDNSPAYYTAYGVEPWEVMRKCFTHEEYKGYLKGSIIAYAMRMGKKPNNPDKQEAEKILNYAKELFKWCSK